MRRRLSEPFDDVTVYLVLNDHGQFGIAFDETDPAKADRETIIRNFLTGQYGNALAGTTNGAAQRGYKASFRWTACPRRAHSTSCTRPGTLPKVARRTSSATPR